MVFGEVQEGKISLKNTGKEKIEEIILYSEQPLFTGFSLKRLGELEMGAEMSHNLFIRATTFTKNELNFLIFYRSGDNWRTRAIYINFMIDGTFRIKACSEVINREKRLVCIDFLNKISEELNWEFWRDIEIQKIFVLSNCWEVDHSSILVERNDNVHLIYFNVLKTEVF